ncbi:MAG: Na+/H+ antiporter NhaC family protein [Cyanobacteria bacterium P01_D01_bin.105]
MTISSSHNNLDLIAVLLFSFVLLIVSALQGIYAAYPLMASLLLFMLALRKRGFALAQLFKMAYAGARKALPVIYVLWLIGILTAVWMAAGTVPALVYYGTGLISPRFFLLWAFVLTGLVSTLIGTSFGTISTLGIALMVMARASGLPENPVAGAIIAGAFVGDRCSPLSSSAHLVAAVTRTNLYRNLRNMLISGFWPLVISLLFYAALALAFPAANLSSTITAALPNAFDLSPVVLLPAIAVLLLAVGRVEVKLAMLVSIGLGVAIAHSLQHYSFLKIFQFSLLGFQLGQSSSQLSSLQTVLLGGGLMPMVKATFVVIISTALAGIFSASKILQFIDDWLTHIRTQRQLKQATAVVSIFSNLFGCTQTIAILLTQSIMHPHYSKYDQKHDQTHELTETVDSQLALDLEDTAVVIAPLIPWNIASLIPMATLSVGSGFIPYAAYLFLLPLSVCFTQSSALTQISACNQISACAPSVASSNAVSPKSAS